MKNLILTTMATGSAAAFLAASMLMPARSAMAENHAGHAMASSEMRATLTGEAEVKGGDSDGNGVFVAVAHPDRGLVCYGLSASGIDPASAAHIHVGVAGVDGGVVVPLTAPTNGTSSGCVEAEKDAIMAIVTDPAGYYVNVHNAAYPAGAIRGQLMK